MTWSIALVAALAVGVRAGRAQTGTAERNCLAIGGRSLPCSQLATRFSALPEFQRRSLGRTPGEQLKAFVQETLAPEFLFVEAARTRRLGERPRVQAEWRDALRAAVVRQLREQVERERPVTDQDVAAFHFAHPELFRRDERIRIFRILVESEAEAQEVIKKTGTSSSVQAWKDLARERSKDRATSERGGDLGFVRADGTTDVPELEVDPALFEAAAQVADGERVVRPVREGSRFAIVWRRGSLPAQLRQLSDEAPNIREFMTQQRTEESVLALIERLRRERVSGLRPDLIESVDYTSSISAGFSAPGATARP